MRNWFILTMELFVVPCFVGSILRVFSHRDMPRYGRGQIGGPKLFIGLGPAYAVDVLGGVSLTSSEAVAEAYRRFVEASLLYFISVSRDSTSGQGSPPQSLNPQADHGSISCSTCTPNHCRWVCRVHRRVATSTAV